MTAAINITETNNAAIIENWPFLFVCNFLISIQLLRIQVVRQQVWKFHKSYILIGKA